jgi:hypothetical protein
MTTTLDNTGAVIPLNTRAGIDFQFVLGVDDANGKPLDLTGYTVEAKLDDGSTVHDLPATLSAPAGVLDTISVLIGHDLTATLPSLSRYSVIVESPTDIRSSIAVGPVTTDGCFPA